MLGLVRWRIMLAAEFWSVILDWGIGSERKNLTLSPTLWMLDLSPTTSVMSISRSSPTFFRTRHLTTIVSNHGHRSTGDGRRACSD